MDASRFSTRKSFGKKVVAVSLGGLAGFGLLMLMPTKGVTQTKAECYKIKSQDTPFADDRGVPRTEIWCYKPLTEPAGATLIYNVDKDGRTIPELSAIVEENGAITHASLLKGNITVHRVNTGRHYNPIPVPLTPPEDAERVAEPISPSSVDTSDRALQVLTTSEVANEDITVRSEGQFIAAVEDAALPWRGFWWPYNGGRLYSGPNSPLGKFDRFVKSRTGKIPGAQAWEGRNHRFTGTPWSGHCNGWAAASTLRKEPLEPIKDILSGITFSVSDMKGIYSERDYCPKIAFFGKRYNGWRGDDITDIKPPLFHNTLAYYLGQLKKPIQIDYAQGVPVENRVVSSYKMNVKGAGENTYIVEATLRIHAYDSVAADTPGVANSFEKTYKYKIWTDPLGNVTDGRWLTANPDFLWVALAPGDCEGGGNSALSERWVESIGKPIKLPW